MTAPHDSVPVEADSVSAAVNTLRGAGLRVSAARRIVLEKLYAAPRPVTAEELAAAGEGSLPPSDLASVYRNLDTLERIGLVRHLHVGHGPGLYAPAHREYAVCERCSSVLPLEPQQADAVRAAIRAACGLEVRFSHFPLVGVCASCNPVAVATERETTFTHPAGDPPAHTPRQGHLVEGAP